VLITTLVTAFSSFLSGHIIHRVGTGVILTASCFLTASALLGYALSPYWLCLLFFSLPLGLGAGAIDSALNHYVAMNYSSRHMNWLHGFWGVGATLGPIIMTWAIASNKGWQFGYITISIIQFALAFVFLFTLKQWANGEQHLTVAKPQFVNVLNDPKAWLSVLMFFFYTGVEVSIGLWAFSLFVEYQGIAKETAGIWVAMYWGALTLGRFLTGILANSFSNRFFVNLGLAGALVGVAMISFSTHITSFLGLAITGFSLAPLYPSMMHETPNRFDKDKTSVMIGYQVGAASVGIAILPALIGLVAAYTTLEILPFVLLGFLITMIIMNYLLNRI
jgi:fucose permease